MSFANLFGALWSKSGEVHYIPYAVGLNATVLLYNQSHLATAGIDPRALTTLDAMLSGRGQADPEGGRRDRPRGDAADLPHQPDPELDPGPGGHVLRREEQQVDVADGPAERAFQWIVDMFDKHGLSWKQNPPGVANPQGRGAGLDDARPGGLRHLQPGQEPPGHEAGRRPPARLRIRQAPLLPAVHRRLLRLPAPPAGRPEGQGGAAFYRQLYTLDSAIDFANDYSGAILIRGMYADPRFKSTTFGPVRATLPETTIARSLTMSNAADPGFMPQVNKVLAGELSVKAALAEMQQTFTAAEDEAQRNRR